MLGSLVIKACRVYTSSVMDPLWVGAELQPRMPMRTRSLLRPEAVIFGLLFEPELPPCT